MKQIGNELEKNTLFWYTTISFIVMVISRIALEYATEPAVVIPPFDSFVFWLQQILYFLVIFVTIALSIGYVTKKGIMESWKKSVSLSWVILLPPIINFIFVKTNIVATVCSGYVGETGINLLRSFVTLGIFKTTQCGVTPGITISLVILALLLFRTLHKETKTVQALAITVIVTIIGFVQGALPGVIGTFSSLVHQGILVQDWLVHTVFPNSFLSSIHYFAFDNTLPENTQQLVSVKSILSQWALYFSRWHYLSLIMIVYFFLKNSSELLFRSVKRSFQYSRLFLYGTLMIFGMRMANNPSLGRFISNNADLASLIILFVSFFCVALAVTVVNDDNDKSIDEISNKLRPIPAGVSLSTYRLFGGVMGILGLLGASLINFPVFLVMLLGGGIVLVYSAPPFRLRNTILGTWFSAFIGSLCALIAGYFLVSLDQVITSIPIVPMVIISGLFAVVILFKDFKDVQGDSKNGVQTVPIMLGYKKAKIVLGLIVAIGMVGITISYYSVTLVCIALIIVGFASINYLRDNFSEKAVFGYFILWLFIIMLFWR